MPDGNADTPSTYNRCICRRLGIPRKALPGEPPTSPSGGTTVHARTAKCKQSTGYEVDHHVCKQQLHNDATGCTQDKSAQTHRPNYSWALPPRHQLLMRRGHADPTAPQPG